MKNKIIQITAGRGPAECQWVAAQTLKLILTEAKAHGILAEVLDRETGYENNTLLSACVRLTHSDLEEWVSGWLGTIQWIGQSPYRKMHKRKNWFIAVNELEQGGDFRFDPKDVRFEFIRAGGPGGQHVNKVSTAVRARHVPTGEMVVSSDQRSQSQNRQLALDKLKVRVLTRHLEAVKEQASGEWKNHCEVERGNPVRVFRGRDFKARHEKKKYKEGRKSDKQKFFKGLEY